jgi:hypothetical protein
LNASEEECVTMMKDKTNYQTHQQTNLPTLHDLTKHPTPNVLIHKVKRHEEETALLLALMVSTMYSF